MILNPCNQTKFFIVTKNKISKKQNKYASNNKYMNLKLRQILTVNYENRKRYEYK